MRTDTELVEAGSAGDRQAFGEIVERYQSLVCAIAYSGTGDVALAQDVAQETFLAAWKGMDALREPSKLKAWLAGIARNLARSAQRRPGFAELERAAGKASSAPSPLDQVLEREQEALVWEALEEIPETYREPLILFYREGRSVERVAEALEVSADAVKQRLSRGRQMLKQQVADLVESALARTRPGRAFTIAVLAVLPAAAPQVAAASVAATAAKGSTAGAGAGSTALAGALWGPLLGVLGAYIGGKASLDATRSPRERAFVKRTIAAAAAYALGFAALELVGLLAFPRTFATVAAQIVIVGLYTAGLVVLIRRGNRRQRQIQIEDGTYVDSFSRPPLDLSRTPRSAVYGSFAGGVFGGTLWMIIMSVVAGDWGAGALILSSAVLIYVACVRAVLSRPERYFVASRASLFAVGALNFAAVNLRWDAWMVAYRGHWTYEPLADWPLWAMNALLAVLFGALFLGEYRRERQARKI